MGEHVIEDMSNGIKTIRVSRKRVLQLMGGRLAVDATGAAAQVRNGSPWRALPERYGWLKASPSPSSDHCPCGARQPRNDPDDCGQSWTLAPNSRQGAGNRVGYGPLAARIRPPPHWTWLR
jgi:hypothetical protein